MDYFLGKYLADKSFSFLSKRRLFNSTLGEPADFKRTNALKAKSCKRVVGSVVSMKNGIESLSDLMSESAPPQRPRHTAPQPLAARSTDLS